jgi:ABC-2 type transport system permease protein
MTGLTVFLRAFWRRDRWALLWWLLGGTAVYYFQAIQAKGQYATQAALDQAAANLERNAGFIAMFGPARALNTIGGQVAWQGVTFGAIIAGLMSMFLVGRHTRAEEEAGRDELVRAGVVGRYAPMTAALLVAALANVLLGLLVALSVVSFGLAAAGALSLGLGVALTGIAFAAVALFAAQLTDSARAMYGITGAVIGVSYGLRAVGDVGGGVLSWFSPIGWYQAMHAYSGERWWPAVLPGALTAVVLVASYALFNRRDIGGGVWPTRPGPARATRSLRGGFGLAWRLQRGSMTGWLMGAFVGGIGYGSIGDDVTSIIGDSQFSRDLFAVEGAGLVDSFYASAALLLAMVFAGFTISSALRPRAEEDAGRVEPLLATALLRRRWLLGHLSMTVLGTIAVLGAGGFGMGLGFGLVTGDWSALGSHTGATLALLPAVLVLGALTELLYGVLPRWASLAWFGLAFSVVVLVFGTLLRFPQWLQDASPFTHLALVPAQQVDWAAFVVVLAVATAITLIGQWAFLRRDVR